ncbi:Hypothetical protein LOCK900_1775 [Lacticaseibacillus rhamnosus LOCK900]|nr:Hypothetical protein LOCK900_1775 [Lacticaseibacillus rhamnosus LOCK900]
MKLLSSSPDVNLNHLSSDSGLFTQSWFSLTFVRIIAIFQSS